MSTRHTASSPADGKSSRSTKWIIGVVLAVVFIPLLTVSSTIFSLKKLFISEDQSNHFETVETQAVEKKIVESKIIEAAAEALEVTSKTDATQDSPSIDDPSLTEQDLIVEQEVMIEESDVDANPDQNIDSELEEPPLDLEALTKANWESPEAIEEALRQQGIEFSAAEMEQSIAYVESQALALGLDLDTEEETDPSTESKYPFSQIANNLQRKIRTPIVSKEIQPEPINDQALNPMDD